MKRFLFAVLFVTSFVFSASAQEDWCIVKRYAKINSEITTPPKVVFIGNSITECWFNEDQEFFTKNNFAGRGIGGQVTAQMLGRFRYDVVDLKPRAVVILAGINDIAHNKYYAESVEHIFANICNMVDIARSNNIKVVLCTLVAADQIGWRQEIDPKGPVAELNALILNYAAKNKIPVADMFAVTADENGGLKDEYRQPNKDAVHPGIKGYKAMEEEVMKAIKTLKIRK